MKVDLERLVTLGDLVPKIVPIDSLTLDPRNARKHSQRNIGAISRSLTKFGQRRAIIVMPDDTVIAGNGTLVAARALGWKEIAVTTVPEDWTQEQAIAYALADNRTAEIATWNDVVLLENLTELDAAGWDIGDLGFDHAILPSEEMADDEVPEPPAEPITNPGDLWILGGHRLLCGDCTVTSDVERLMNGKRAHLMATDPPYLVDYDGGNHPQTWANGGKEPLAEPDAGTKHWDAYTDHDSAVAFYRDFLATAMACALTDRPTVYQWFATMKTDIVFESWRANGLWPHQMVIWKKTRAILTHSWFLYDFEPCLVGWVQGKMPPVDRRPPSTERAVWEVGSIIEDSPGQIHPTMKPVELIRRPIEWHTEPGEVIYEPFCGSGTAIIAAERTGRCCYALELSPAFVDVAVKRWENLTRQTAVREAS